MKHATRRYSLKTTQRLGTPYHSDTTALYGKKSHMPIPVMSTIASSVVDYVMRFMCRRVSTTTYIHI